jgi:hypothetical protein
MSDFIDMGIFETNKIRITKDMNDHFLISVNYKCNDLRKLITFFHSYPKFWYEFKTNQILCDGNNIDDINNSEKPKIKSFVILMKSQPNDQTSIGNINSISNLDDLSMSNTNTNTNANTMSDVFIRKNKNSLETSSIGINETDGRRNNLSAQEINTALEKNSKGIFTTFTIISIISII